MASTTPINHSVTTDNIVSAANPKILRIRLVSSLILLALAVSFMVFGLFLTVHISNIYNVLFWLGIMLICMGIVLMTFASYYFNKNKILRLECQKYTPSKEDEQEIVEKNIQLINEYRCHILNDSKLSVPGVLNITQTDNNRIITFYNDTKNDYILSKSHRRVHKPNSKYEKYNQAIQICENFHLNYLHVSESQFKQISVNTVPLLGLTDIIYDLVITEKQSCLEEIESCGIFKKPTQESIEIARQLTIFVCKLSCSTTDLIIKCIKNAPLKIALSNISPMTSYNIENSIFGVFKSPGLMHFFKHPSLIKIVIETARTCGIDVNNHNIKMNVVNYLQYIKTPIHKNILSKLKNSDVDITILFD